MQVAPWRVTAQKISDNILRYSNMYNPKTTSSGGCFSEKSFLLLDDNKTVIGSEYACLGERH